MRKMDEIVWIFGAIAIIAVIITTFLFSGVGQVIETEEFDVWITDAPFGTYWTETSGKGNFFVYSETSNLRESYTITYKVGNELKSVYLDFSDEDTHIYLMNNISDMKLVHTKICNTFYGAKLTLGQKDIYELYIPDPDLFNTGDEKNEN